MKQFHVAMLGTRGVPARYGGFETAVEEVGQRLALRGHRVTVYCRGPVGGPEIYRGMKRIRLPAVNRRELETISHTGLSVGHLLVRERPDCALIFNAANAAFLPLLRLTRTPAAVHIDGLEWRRRKWGKFGRRYYRAAEAFAVRRADAVVADARAIGTYVERTYGREASFIPYGAALVEPRATAVEDLGLRSRGYHLVVARFEPENNVDVIVGAYAASSAKLPLVVVGDSRYGGAYRDEVFAKVDRSDVRFLGSVWDQELLDQLYANCASYIHGHSVGGTNPSLLRAMGARASVVALDVEFNREVTAGSALFFANEADLAAMLVQLEADASLGRRIGEAARLRAETAYTWDAVTDEYERLCDRLARRRGGGAINA
jgi:glycosyltransferase involved in cell wall biosynthesis